MSSSFSATKANYEWDAKVRALIVQATERHCPKCGEKIDRKSPPEGYGRLAAPDGESRDPEDLMWPRWHCHAHTCTLRIEAEGLSLP